MQASEFNTGVIKPIECVKEGFERIKSDFWLLLAIWLVGGLIGGISLFIAAGAMTCGTFYCFLRKIDGESVKFDDLWKGMQWFGPGLIVMLIIIVPILALYLMIYLPFVLAAVAGSQLGPEAGLGLLIGALAIDLVLLVATVCVHTLLMFAFPLIVDRNMGAGQAIKTSARAVMKNLSGVVGLIAVNFVLVLGGYLALCVGVYLAIPIIIAGNVVAYRRVFPRLDDDRRFERPPVSAVGGG
ncbi:MAG TPA: hypothetical protein VNA17_03625 [Pyrinomonadaceae bacterium]|nr:hypothetical protein [Pyrinomonadaceae bacterium]